MNISQSAVGIYTEYYYLSPSTLLCGRFAAALIENNLDCWVMNVVPVSGPNTLPVIYDRGLLGVMHDWYSYAIDYVLVFKLFCSIRSFNFCW